MPNRVSRPTVGVLLACAAIVKVHGPTATRDHLAAALLDEADRIRPETPEGEPQ